MNLTKTITAQRMQAANVPFHDANWYFNVGRPRKFNQPGDAKKAFSILLKTIRAGAKPKTAGAKH